MSNTAMHPEWVKTDNSLDIDQLMEESKKTPILLFKHSTTCGISAASKAGLEENYEKYLNNTYFYYIDLLKYRKLSDKVAEELGVLHQSPQIILLMNGEVKFHTSHQGINSELIESKIKEHLPS